ncbi:SNF2-related protein, partial [Patulibacter sp. NPDC049589]|uniref:SNF2-related protein n=1 Tax=Patulibacter sp. NPDC049589 TaxID=3154731 RepID=UPI003418A4E9
EVFEAKVVGSGRIYETELYVFTGRDGRMHYDWSDCSCPVGSSCKHVAAVAITADQGRVQRSTGRKPPATTPALPDWERPLHDLFVDDTAHGAGIPLAISIVARRAQDGVLELHARLKRPGARGGWINGDLRWDGFSSRHVGRSEYRGDHLDLAAELWAVFQARQSGRSTSSYSSYAYGPSQTKTLDLGAFNSPQLWPLLERAREQEIALVHGRRALGKVELLEGDLCFDVEDRDDGIDARVVLRVAGVAADLVPVAFIGAGGHGLVCTTPEAADLDPDRWPLRLVRLERPAPPALQRMVLTGTPLRVPPDQAERFAHEIAPGLRRHAPVVSSDGSFVVPEVSAPRLELRATHGDDHGLELAWEWRYEIDGQARCTPFAATRDGYRDLRAERAAIEATVVDDEELRRLGLVDGRGRPQSGVARLSGLDTAEATTELLPRLAGHEGVDLRRQGTPADYRDVGDELEVGFSTQASDGDHDWFDLGVTIRADGQDVPFERVFTALADGAEHLLLADGAHFSLTTPKLQALRALIDEARALADTPAGAPLKISRYQAGLWEDLVALGVVTEQAAAWQRQIDGLTRLDALADHALPTDLDADLRPYQQDGYRWLTQLWDLQLGGILADDMGLGKTLQALALIAHAKERDPEAGPFLVVAPTSVVAGWVAEAARFTPGLVVRALTDTLKKAGVTLAEALDGTDVLVTTYTLLRLDAEHHCAVPWAGVILDEAQQVKNHQAKTHGCVRRLDAPFKLAITGTPMENGLMELWALFSITAPGLFPSPKRFDEQYVRPIERGHDAERLDRLRRRVRPLMLRRTKDLVAADLPPKQIQALPVGLHPRHRQVYDTHLQRERQRILGLLQDFDKNRFTILRAITLLRQMSLHPVLVDPQYATVPCAKLTALVGQLEDVVGGGHRALVFSQFT